MQAGRSFGGWLKQQRKTLDLTQAELAGRVGCARITIQKIEAGERRPSKAMAERLAEHLNVSAQDYAAFIIFSRTGKGASRFVLAHKSGFPSNWERFQPASIRLPAQPTVLIGREHELALARRRLLREDVRLLTLVGPPGVGKTRLAIQIAAHLADEFEEGVFFVPLASISDPDLVAQTIAQNLNVNQIGQQSFTERLKEYLRDQHCLLVLDNFEQVLPAASYIAGLLAACPWLSILVTSRAPLSIRGEHQLPVVPLTIPPKENSAAMADTLMDYSAINLFVERTRDCIPDFTLNNANATTIIALCRRVDGLPLALELVAARLCLLPPQTLLEQLSTNSLLHVSGLRDVSPRHQTLAAAIDWSYALLTAPEQHLLAGLSVFINGWTLEAATRVMVGFSPDSTREMLQALVSNHLVMRHERNGVWYFSLLETIQAYATERLAEAGETDQFRQQHAEYYLELVESADPHLRTAAQDTWLDLLEGERGNIQAAFSWFLTPPGDFSKGLQLAGAMGWFWNIRSHVSEGRAWLEKSLLQCSDSPPEIRIRALNYAGSLAWQQSDLIAARAYLEQSIHLCREFSPALNWNLALALAGFANVVMYQIDQEALNQAAQESHSIFNQIGDTWGIALSLCLVGEVLMLQHDYPQARAQFENSLALMEKIGDKWGTGVALMDLGYTNMLLGNLDLAQLQLEHSIALHRALGERFIRSVTLNVLAQVVEQQGDALLTTSLYNESLDLLRKMGLEARIAEVQFNLAHFVHAHGHLLMAQKLYRESLELYSKQGNQEGIARSKQGLQALIQ